MAAVGPFELRWSDDTPLALVAPSSAFVGRESIGLVEVFTAAQQRARTSQAYRRSEVGERLRVQSSQVVTDAIASSAIVLQLDAESGLEVRTTVTVPSDVSVVRIEHEIRNAGPTPVVLTALTSAVIGVGATAEDLDHVVWGTAASEWLAENRWREVRMREVLPAISLGLHGQDGRGHAALTSHGAWSSGEHVPCGYLVRADGEALAWQIETSAGWHVDMSQTLDGGVLSLLGPADLEHHFAHELLPGETFTSVAVAMAVSADAVDGAMAQLTRYRRWLRGAAQRQELPVVYNDFMNTLMGQPTTEKLLPLIRRAADAGAEVFCIDAGWFADPTIGDWWSTVGEWREAPSRFSNGGLKRVIDEIHDSGMIPGLWLEPEVIGIDSPVAASLPDAAFFVRHGTRVQEDRRFHLDFRHPAARAHIDQAVDHLVEEFGIRYLKLDYNINPGVGTEHNATGAGDGLLAHTRAFRDWLQKVQVRHPRLLIENCSSGAMRADYSLLAVTHLQSTSDQQDYLLYPPIAASAPASILPEQCGNWAYPAREMTDEQTVFSLVTGLSGRLYLSGFFDDLRPDQRARISEAIALHKELRADLTGTVPFWPLGFPEWDAEVVGLGLRSSDAELVFVWDRNEKPTSISLPGVVQADVLFPTEGEPWNFRPTDEGLSVTTPEGVGARVLRVHRG
ncbi:glycoside hydrolase family 36 protein [Microbacterium sp. Bi98]|uniref:glycoside hydrolase family 36 protein n=1 Tax=Microbacterium sp. Bi98 TaxID=2821116 RepID=UPI001E5CB7CB|nr:glycoside hydrolase family 36 protein [Microbacterium sp. Bi98]